MMFEEREVVEEATSRWWLFLLTGIGWLIVALIVGRLHEDAQPHLESQVSRTHSGAPGSGIVQARTVPVKYPTPHPS